MLQSYTPEFKKKIVCLHEEEGRMERYFNTLKTECTNLRAFKTGQSPY